MRAVRYHVRLGVWLTPGHIQYLEAIPGVRGKDTALPRSTVMTTPEGEQVQAYPYLEVPVNAIDVVTPMLSQWGIQFAATVDTRHLKEDIYPSQLVLPPEKIPELKPELVSMIKPFQREGLQFCQQAMGALAHWPTGCLTGDTILTVNRGGGARKICLDRLVHRMEGCGSDDGRGRNGSRWDLTIPTRTQSRAPDGTLVLNEITRAVFTGVKPVFKVVTESGHSLRATADHRFIIGDEERRLSELVVGDEVEVVNPTQGTGTRKPKTRDKYMHLAKHPYATRTETARGEPHLRHLRRVFARVAYHRLAAEASASSLDVPTFIARVRSGDHAGLVFLDPKLWHVHHKDRDHHNNDPANLAVLSAEDHRQEHGPEYRVNVAQHVMRSRIVSITPDGTERTYDLSMAAPLHNYVANGIVVHNSGKTVLGILWALSHRRYDGKPHKTVVVTRAITCIQWRNVFQEWTRKDSVNIMVLESRSGFGAVPATEPELDNGSLPFKVVNNDWNKGAISWHETKEAAEKDAEVRSNMILDIPPEVQVVILSIDNLASRVRALLTWNPRSFVVDESHRFKSKDRWRVTDVDKDGRPKFDLKENQTGAAARMAKHVSRLLCLTATPAPDRPKDLWGQFDLCDPFGWGRFRTWAIRYAAAVDGPYGLIADGESNAHELNIRKSYVMHTVPQSRVDAEMPPLRRAVITLSASELDQATAGQREWAAAKKGGHSVLLELRIAIACAMKRSYLVKRVELAMEEGRHVVVFTGRKADANRLHGRLKTMAERLSKKEGTLNREVKAYVVHGDLPDQENKAAADEFIAHKGPAVLVATVDKLGEAFDGFQKVVTLAIVALLPWNYGKLLQLEGRFKRFGASGEVMSNGVVIEYVIAQGTVDEEIFDRVLSKLAIGGRILDDADVKQLNEDLLGTEADAENAIDLLAESLLASFDASINTDDIRVDFSPEGTRLRHAGEGIEGEDTAAMVLDMSDDLPDCAAD